jgi:hypothetical protein
MGRIVKDSFTCLTDAWLCAISPVAPYRDNLLDNVHFKQIDSPIRHLLIVIEK